MRSDDSRATILLVSPMVAEGTRPLKASEYWRLLDQLDAPGQLLRSSNPAELVDDDELAARVRVLLDRATSIAFELDRLEQSGIATLTPWDDDYPHPWRERMPGAAPPVIHAAGPLQLLREPAVGLLTDGNPPVELVSDLVEEAAGWGRALAHGGRGPSVGILADPLLGTLRRPDVRRAVLAGTTLLCTPFAPDARPGAPGARACDRLIQAHARFTVCLPGTEREPGITPITGAEDLAALLADAED